MMPGDMLTPSPTANVSPAHTLRDAATGPVGANTLASKPLPRNQQPRVPPAARHRRCRRPSLLTCFNGGKGSSRGFLFTKVLLGKTGGSRRAAERARAQPRTLLTQLPLMGTTHAKGTCRHSRHTDAAT